MTEKMAQTTKYPFCALVGQEMMKEAIVLNMIDPGLGGVLIRGQKGTAKTTAVRGIPDLMPDMKVVEIPANATEDRVAGSIDIEAALKDGEKRLEAGLLWEADGNVLYVDEINLLDDHLVDLLLDAAATGLNTVEREGISYTHSSRFVLIGLMNPEEGNLRPQLLDRFGMVVDVKAEEEVERRVQIIKNRLAFEADPEGFREKYQGKQEALGKKIRSARELLPQVQVSGNLLELAAQIGIAYGTDGHRADIGMIKTAKALAALDGRKRARKEDLERAARYVLPHQRRKVKDFFIKFIKSKVGNPLQIPDLRFLSKSSSHLPHFVFQHTLDFIAHGFRAGGAEMDANLVSGLSNLPHQCRGVLLRLNGRCAGRFFNVHILQGSFLQGIRSALPPFSLQPRFPLGSSFRQRE